MVNGIPYLQRNRLDARHARVPVVNEVEKDLPAKVVDVGGAVGAARDEELRRNSLMGQTEK